MVLRWLDAFPSFGSFGEVFEEYEDLYESAYESASISIEAES